jgi:GntR family transcriptional regulator
MKPEKKPLYIIAKEYMLKKIKQMIPGNNQLEPEHQLTAKLNMSRETIRKAMSTLIQDGIVTRWHGKGNFGHPEVTNLPMRMDINSDFRRLLKNAGYKVDTWRTESSITAPTADLLKRIPEAMDKEVVEFGQSFFANGQLAIQCRVELLREYVTEIPEEGYYTENINDFLMQHCNRETSYTIAWLNAGLNSEISEKFGLPPMTPLLVWEEIYYDIFDFKLGYVKIYFHPETMDLSLLLNF